MNRLLLFCLGLFLLSSCGGDAGKARVDELTTSGVKVENERVAAWFPKDSVPDIRMRDIADSLQQIIIASEQLIGKQPWQQYRGKKINYYFNEGNFVSVANANGDVFIPLWRITSGQAPVHHETMHVLLRTKEGNWNSVSKVASFFTIPMWFTEGVAEYLAMKVSHDTKVPKFDLQKSGGYLKVDSTCNAALKTEVGQYVVDYIGEEGAMLKLFTSDRKTYAPPFYNCSCSFTKYLGETYGTDVLLQSNAQFKDEQETLEQLTKKDLSTLKEEWLTNLKKQYK